MYKKHAFLKDWLIISGISFKTRKQTINLEFCFRVKKAPESSFPGRKGELKFAVWATHTEIHKKQSHIPAQSYAANNDEPTSRKGFTPSRSLLPHSTPSNNKMPGASYCSLNKQHWTQPIFPLKPMVTVAVSAGSILPHSGIKHQLFPVDSKSSATSLYLKCSK